MATREECYEALFTLLENAAPFKVTSRRYKPYDQVPNKPAMFLVQTDVEYIRVERLPAKMILGAELFIYLDTKSMAEDQLPALKMNTILDRVDELLAAAPYPPCVQTLGGLVSHCWIEGQQLVTTGDIDGVGISITPIKMLVPTTD